MLCKVAGLVALPFDFTSSRVGITDRMFLDMIQGMIRIVSNDYEKARNKVNEIRANNRITRAREELHSSPKWPNLLLLTPCVFSLLTFQNL